MFSKGPNCTQAFCQTKRIQIPQPCMPSFCSPVASVYSRSRITASRYLCLHAFHRRRDQTHNRQFRVSCPPDLDSYGRRGSATQAALQRQTQTCQTTQHQIPPFTPDAGTEQSVCFFFNTSRDILQVTFFFFFLPSHHRRQIHSTCRSNLQST